ncbi:MAG: response regulator [Kofleriaceae bacterium]|nr:response regulator [Kofleriaceae bacterium]MCL4225315.1 response regulator [Myxococcales bacterium]
MTAASVLLRAEIAAVGAVAPALLVDDETLVVRCEAPARPGDRLRLRLSFPGLLAPLDVEGEIVACRSPGAPGEHAEWRLALSPGEATASLRRLRARTGDPAHGDHLLRLLLVEDSALLGDVFRAGLARHLGPQAPRVQVDVAADAERAWALCAAAAYDLVVVDYFLPGDRGDALIARLREAPATAATPVVAISLGGAEARTATLAAGADVFLDKPLALAELTATLRLLLTKEAPMPCKRILIMDDSVLFLELTQEALARAGYEVVTARDLTELETHTGEPDLVLMDVQMPEAFGDDLAMVLRHVRGLDAPIYLLSSLDPSELERRAADAGVDGYISKHLGIEAVVGRVDEITGGPRGTT